MTTAEATVEKPSLEPEEMDEILEAIEEAELAVRHKEFELHQAKDVVKMCKAAMDDAVLRLRELCRARYADEERPLLNMANGESSNPERWRTVAVTELKIPNGIITKLHEAKITTIGDLADWGEGGNLLTDIPGVGPSKAEAIEEAMTEFWSDNPDLASARDESKEDDSDGDGEEEDDEEQ